MVADRRLGRPARRRPLLSLDAIFAGPASRALAAKLRSAPMTFGVLGALLSPRRYA